MILCLAVRYVTYDGPDGDPVANEDDVSQELKAVNRIWSGCGIQFQVEEYLSVLPSEYGLRYRTQSYGELDDVRETFRDPKRLLVVYTGPWDRSGDIGSTGANAWTNLPGDDLYGSIIEARVAGFAPILAHELGHYLSLGHVSRTGALIQPLVGRTSTGLNEDECDSAGRQLVRTGRKCCG